MGLATRNPSLWPCNTNPHISCPVYITMGWHVHPPSLLVAAPIQGNTPKKRGRSRHCQRTETIGLGGGGQRSAGRPQLTMSKHRWVCRGRQCVPNYRPKRTQSMVCHVSLWPIGLGRCPSALLRLVSFPGAWSMVHKSPQAVATALFQLAVVACNRAAAGAPWW